MDLKQDVRIWVRFVLGCGEGLVAAKLDAVMSCHVSTTGGEFLDKLSACNLFYRVLQLTNIYYYKYQSAIMMIGASRL
jgi:hypothetical protein